MFRFTCSAFLLALTLSAGCGEGTPDTSFVSEAIAAPANVPDYGWRTDMSPSAGDGAVTEYY